MSTIRICWRYWHTLRYLKLKQIVCRIFFYFYKPQIQPIAGLTLRFWPKNWHAPLFMFSALSDDGKLTFLNQTAHLDDVLLWSDPKKTRLWLYNLHYFDVLNAKDADLRVELLGNFIQQWIDDNIPAHKHGWEPYQLSLRIVNWIKWFSRQQNQVKKEWLVSLAMQAEALVAKLEYHILGNHLFANAKALLFAGAYFNGLRATHWLNKGLKIFKQQIAEQFLSDGGHFERSPMYHAILLWDLCDLYNLATITKIPALLDLQLLLAQAINRGLQWLKLMSHPDGDISFFNDAALGVAARYQDLLTYVQQLQINTNLKILRGKSCLEAHLLKDSGYGIIILGEENKAIVDVAAIGPDYQPGHAHADTLSFEFSLFKQRFIVNSGISEYEIGQLRQQQRSTKAHNTVCVDQKNSSDVWAGFRVARRARPFNVKVVQSPRQVTIEGSHNGYSTNWQTIVHLRKWQFAPQQLTIYDQISGFFSQAEARFYLHPDVMITSINENFIICCLAAHQQVKIILLEGGNLSLMHTNWYPTFGTSAPNYCLIAKFRTNKIVTQFQW